LKVVEIVDFDEMKFLEKLTRVELGRIEDNLEGELIQLILILLLLLLLLKLVALNPSLLEYILTKKRKGRDEKRRGSF